MRWMVLAAALAASCASARAEAPSAEWIGGYWLSCEGGRQTAEAWIGAGSGVMAGVNVSQGEGEAGFEYMRIAPGSGGGLSLFASPGGASAVEFALARSAGGRFVFENPAHDFPQRVIYQRDGDTLIGRIEGGDAAMEWRFARAEMGARCAD